VKNVSTNGLQEQKENLYNVRNVKVQDLTNREKKKRKNNSDWDTTSSSVVPHIPQVKGVIAMMIYTFLPDIFFPTFDSLKTSLLSGVI